MRQHHPLKMFRKLKVLVVVTTLATVGQFKPLDPQVESYELATNHRFFGRYARDVSSADTVNQITNILEEGGKIPKEAMGMMQTHFKKFDALLKEADNNIASIQRELGKVGEIDITREYLDAYWQAKKELRLARTDLRELALRTTKAVQDIKILIENWDDKETAFIEKEFQILKSLINESLRVLKDAKEKYVNAINYVEKTSNQLSETKTSLSLMLDEKSTEYDSWTKKVRGGVYGSASAVTVGMIVADVMGCFGLCSAIVTTSVWGGSFVGVEASIENYKSELAKLETVTSGVLGQIIVLEETVTESIQFLEQELVILQSWEVAADSVKAKMALFSVDDLKRVAAFQKIFVKNLDDLGASAQAFLDQGAQIFSNDDGPVQN